MRDRFFTQNAPGGLPGQFEFVAACAAIVSDSRMIYRPMPGFAKPGLGR